MNGEPIRKIRGRIVMLQEHFFRTVAEDGQCFLLTLSVDASTRREELQAFLRENTPVEVEYRGAPGLETGEALRVQPVSEQIRPATE